MTMEMKTGFPWEFAQKTDYSWSTLVKFSFWHHVWGLKSDKEAVPRQLRLKSPFKEMEVGLHIFWSLALSGQ